ncbi:hypothetical protein N7474_004930 [Penicillium riverlandense]|uniref:uncharacterized protein n=1 Tax=Penicillium riverlandense TaxID=1903569 RepID=UPI0025494062|nr:uncharacterized protein N7474_004930 [Penicillium riverlandense]KAJ5819339.1 hypothetical protein N7474_004930 [Penicillium riverlandense]
MANLYYLNNPPHPLWDYISSALEEHPFFAPQGRHPHNHHRGPHPHPFGGWGATPQAEDVPQQPEEQQAGPSNKQQNEDNSSSSSDSEPSGDEKKHRRGKRGGKGKCRAHGKGCGKGKHGPGPHHAGPFGGPCGRGGPYQHHRGGPGGYWFGGRGGRRGPRGWHHGPHPHHHGGPPPFAQGGPGFPDFNFLRNLGAQFGFPLAAESPEGVDFVPTVDVFDMATKYIVHVSLPGAKKEDLSIDYDVGESVLRLAGVVYRPGITEDLHQGLVMEERAREVGVFEREVRLGTRAAPAAVVVEEISAKLEDGVLNVTVPKVQEPEVSQKKKVVVVEEEVNEKDAMHVDESDSETATPDEGSEGSDAEGEAREYVKVAVQ